jgi:hypothetical protein
LIEQPIRLSGAACLRRRRLWDGAVYQVGCCLRHPPHSGRAAEPAALAPEGQRLVVVALAAAQPQEAQREDAELEEGVEDFPNEPRQLRSGAGPGVCDEAGCVLQHQAVQRGLLGEVAVAVERRAIPRTLGLQAGGSHDELPKG